MARLDEKNKMKFVSETYIVLTKIDFTSARKRMSLVMQMPDGTVRLMVKVCVYNAILPIEACTVQGADSVVKDRLADEQDRVAALMQLKQVQHLREHPREHPLRELLPINHLF